METDPPEPKDSTPPETAADEPVAPVPTSETTPVWAQTRPVVPAGDEAAEPVPIKKGDPDWSEPEDASSNGGAPKKAPEWAQTVPTSPGDEIEDGGTAAPKVETTAEEAAAVEVKADKAAEPAPPVTAAPVAHDMWDEAATEPPAQAEVPEAEVTPAPINEPPKAVAADALKSTWPPRAESAAAPPTDTDVWPPDPPTEKAMPAWPPPSELDEPATPAQAIPSWPDSFDSTPGATKPDIPVKPEEKPASGSAPTAPPRAEEPEPVAQTAPPTEPETIPPGPQTQPAVPAPSVAEPSQPQPPANRPAWAPGPTPAEPSAATAAHAEQSTAYQVPSWAPRVPLAAEPGTPTWFSPKEQIPHPTTQPVAQPAPPKPPPAPMPPAEGGHLPVAPVPKPAEPAPAQADSSTSKSSWQVVEQKHAAKGPTGPTAEDRSYAEWFSWAKRGGAPASACHAAAQGAFKALSSGKDVTTAVQWATAAMSRPPENVSYARQQYCAWFALANIDLNLDQHRSHAFAGAAIQALDAGADSSQAHAAGLAAAGIR